MNCEISNNGLPDDMNLSFSTDELFISFSHGISNVKFPMTPINLHWSKSQTCKSRVSPSQNHCSLRNRPNSVHRHRFTSQVSDPLLLHFSFFVFTMWTCLFIVYTLQLLLVFNRKSAQSVSVKLPFSDPSVYIPDANVFGLF